MQVQQYIVTDEGVIKFSDQQANLLERGGLLTKSETIPALLERTPFVDTLGLADVKLIELLQLVARAAPPEPTTPRF